MPVIICPSIFLHFSTEHFCISREKNRIISLSIYIKLTTAHAVVYYLYDVFLLIDDNLGVPFFGDDGNIDVVVVDANDAFEADDLNPPTA
jgi:hypothetical protein